MRVIISGDWHLGVLVAGRNMNEQIKKTAAVIIDSTAGADLFVHLGDVFDSSRPSPESYAIAIELLNQLDCPALILKGNHDESRGLEPDALEPLRKSLFRQEVRIVDHPEVILYGEKQLMVLPYLNDSKAKKYFVDGSAQQAVDYVVSESKAKDVKVDAVFGHLDVVGARLPSGMVMRGGRLQLPWKELDSRWQIFNGHIHVQQKIQNVECVGSVIPTDFGDESESKFYAKLEV